MYFHKGDIKMIRIQQRERGFYVEQFHCGMWKLRKIVDTQQEALMYVREHFKQGEYVDVKLQTKQG